MQPHPLSAPILWVNFNDDSPARLRITAGEAWIKRTLLEMEQAEREGASSFRERSRSVSRLRLPPWTPDPADSLAPLDPDFTTEGHRAPNSWKLLRIVRPGGVSWQLLRPGVDRTESSQKLKRSLLLHALLFSSGPKRLRETFRLLVREDPARAGTLLEEGVRYAERRVQESFHRSLQPHLGAEDLLPLLSSSSATIRQQALRASGSLGKRRSG